VIIGIAAEEEASFVARTGGSAWSPRASLAGPDRCRRQQVYWALGIPRRPLPGRAVIVFDDGRWHEELTLDWIRRSAFRVHSEQMEIVCGSVARPDGSRVAVRGHIDALLQTPIGEEWLLEHKALNPYTYERLVRGEEIPEDYVAQCVLYLSGLASISKVAGAVLLVKNKASSAYLEFRIEWTRETDVALLSLVEVTSKPGFRPGPPVRLEGVLAGALARFEVVLAHVAAKTLPPRDYRFDDWQCSYCGWGDLCWAGYVAELARADAPLSPEAERLAAEADAARTTRLAAEKDEREKKRRVAEAMHVLGAASAAGERFRVSVVAAEGEDGRPTKENVTIRKQVVGNKEG
jgi:hypothetical protein